MSDVELGFETSNVLEADWHDYYRVPGGVWRNWLNGCVVSAPGGLLAVTVGTGRATALGGRFGRTVAANLAIDPNASGQTRTDVVVVRMNRSTNSIHPDIVKGTPSGGLSVPALSITADTFDIPLALVTILNNQPNIQASDIKDVRSYIGMMYNSIATSETTASAGFTDLATVGPRVEAVWLPSGLAKVTLIATVTNGAMGVSLRNMSDVELTAPSLVAAIENDTATPARMSQSFIVAANPVTAGYYRFVPKYMKTAGALATFVNRTLIVESVSA